MFLTSLSLSFPDLCNGDERRPSAECFLRINNLQHKHTLVFVTVVINIITIMLMLEKN